MNISRLITNALSLLMLGSITGAQNAGSIPKLDNTNSFPFVIPWNDVLKGTATDASFLNDGPAGKNGRILAKGSIFIEEKTGKRIRFFGTNLGAKACFPPREEAETIAMHLAKMGVNIVRMHHLNNGWDNDGGNVWKKGKTYLEIDPAQLDKLDYFISMLKKHGIYVNMNLQTSREYLPEMGFPDSVKQIPNFQKKVDKYNEKMIRLQQQYARELIGRTNPYTKLKYADDPAIMVVEINNENSLVGWPGESPGSGLEKMPEPFIGELRTLWNNWLKTKYSSTAALNAAWPTVNNITGPSVTNGTNNWTWENQSNGDVSFSTEPIAGGMAGAPTLVAEIRDNKGPNWHIQAHLAGLDLKNNQTYTVQFRAKADRDISVVIDSRLSKPDWRFLGLSGAVSLTPQWKNYTLTFTPTNTEPSSTRIGLVLGDIRGKIWIQGLQVRPGTIQEGLPAGQTIESGNVAIPTVGASAAYKDYASFLTELETSFSTRMRKFLRDELGFKKTNLIDSQIAWGGTTSLVRERESDFADNHEYWNHPTFLGKDWDPQNYRVERKALVNTFTSGAGTLGALSNWRVADKPYSVSEYNHPAPSDFQVEMMPLYGTVGAYQDWDIIYTFAWDATGTGVKNDQYDNFFDVGRNPAKKAFFPGVAMLFRQGLITPATAQSMVTLGAKPWERGMFPSGTYSRLGITPPNIFTSRLSVAFDPTATGDKAKTASEGGKSPFKVSGLEGKMILTAEAPGAVVVNGFVSGKAINLENSSFKFGNLPTGFASLMLVPKDGRDWGTAKTSLLTVMSRVENQNMGWNAARDSVSDQWGNGPVRAETVPVEISLKTDGPRKVMALDGSGKPVREVKSVYRNGFLVFEIDQSARSAWFSIIK